MARSTVNIDAETLETFEQFCAASGRKIGQATDILIRWAMSQDSDLRAAIFDGLSPQAEVKVLELLLDRAKKKAAGKFHATPLKLAAAKSKPGQ